jgi:hypothetical protein
MNWNDAFLKAMEPGFAEAAIPDGYVRKAVNCEACALAYRQEIAWGYAAAAARIAAAQLAVPEAPQEQLAFWIGYLAYFEEKA